MTPAGPFVRAAVTLLILLAVPAAVPGQPPGPRGMPAFGGHLPAESIWKPVAYLRSLEPARDTLATTGW